jgi:hypothetical protein
MMSAATRLIWPDLAETFGSDTGCAPAAQQASGELCQSQQRERQDGDQDRRGDKDGGDAHGSLLLPLLNRHHVATRTRIAAADLTKGHSRIGRIEVRAPVTADSAAMASSIPAQSRSTRRTVSPLASIAARALGCSFSLTKLPGALERIYVFFDGAAIPQDTGHENGWDFEAGSGKVTFYGKACQALSGGSVKDLDFVYGCKQPAAPKCKPSVIACSGSTGCPAGHGCVGGCCIKVVE